MQRFLYILLFLSMPALAGTLAGGYTHSLAINNADGGRVLAWGDNTYGQLGNAANVGSPWAISVFGLTGVTHVGAGNGFSVALDSSGYAWAWGRNDYGQVGDTTTTQRNSPVRVSRLSNVIHVAAGRDFALAVKSDGTVWGWGSNTYGQLGVAASTAAHYTAPVQIAAGVLTNVQKVAGGEDFALALKSDGTVWAWGANDYGQLGVGNTTSNVTPQLVALNSGTVITELAASGHAMALTNNGRIWTWGRNDWGQLGDETTTARTSPVQVVDITDATAIANAGNWSLALRSDATLWGWGENTNGQLLDQTKTERHYPVKATGLSEVTAVGAGLAFAVAAEKSGAVKAWGVNSSGQLADGTTNDNYGTAKAVLKSESTALVLESSAPATPVAKATISGGAANLTLSVVITPATANMGRNGFPVVWAELPGAGKFYLSVFGWLAGTISVPYSGVAPLKQIEIAVLKDFNAAAFPGAKVYAGYGFVAGETLDSSRYAEIYTVP